MFNSSIVLLLSITLGTCALPKGSAVTIGDVPQYPTPPEAHHAPTPPASSGWVKIQNERWNEAQIKPEKLHFVQALSSSIQRNKTRYTTVQEATGVPWTVIGAIHNMEASQNFRCNLGQGDPLTSQSRHVPAGRPPIPPNPPFTWEYAAEDALRFDKMDRKQWYGIGYILNNVELYNGAGYQKYHPSIPSPYLWNWSTIQRPGKYIADGTWSNTAISEQCGVCPILKVLYAKDN